MEEKTSPIGAENQTKQKRRRGQEARYPFHAPRECGGWEPGIQIPEGRSINVLIRTQGERFKVLQDDEGRSDGKPELIVFPSSRLIAEKDLTGGKRYLKTGEKREDKYIQASRP
ncbi:hypothetical protein NQZ68_005000 [Dissostichus eleginoides]|nr:hypothetical protein NQZ68_005000 [Dissostichus eleginoides]